MFDYKHLSFEFPISKLTAFLSLFDLHSDTKTTLPQSLIENFDANLHFPRSPI